MGVGFSPVADAFGSDGSIDSAHRLACPDGDLRLRADPTALLPLDPEAGWAWAPGSRWERAANQLYGADQRHFCLRQAQRLQAAGLDMQAGYELEWMVLSTDASGAEQSVVIGGPYGADRLVDGLDYATAVLQALDEAQLPWLQFHPELVQVSLNCRSPRARSSRLQIAS